MRKRRNHLRSVGSEDPSSVFDDLDTMRHDQRDGTARRARSAQTFARIPHTKGPELYRFGISGAAWAVLIELDRLLLRNRGKNPIKFSSRPLREAGLKQQTRHRALRQLEAAGVIKVVRHGRGACPWVTHTWYPERE